ncbi:hypothetical protein ONZ51_g9128 [Trametes cubensis]|uniref:Uncharacterized protein n=1 Tax=Trametes cubensis TaxID=1111947 RepID=A0AAD7TNS4_9APHY|nr:hypothetical protein ONZ51_g9128 [Trametes cubensis]
MSTQFIPFEPQLRQPYELMISNRDRIRSELRAILDGKLQELTGIVEAHMRYTVDGYASRIVCQYGLKLVDWPQEIPFENLSDLIGGIRVLSTLRDAWDDGTLRFERATPEDIENATRDPASVHPNPSLLHWRNGAEPAVAGHPHHPTAPILMPLVLHPGNLSVLGRHPTAMNPGTILGKRARQQRRDVKKPRRKPVKNPDNRPPRRPRRGVTSSQCVIDASDVEVAESEIEEFSDVEEPAAKRTRAGRIYWVTDDPLGEFI